MSKNVTPRCDPDRFSFLFAPRLTPSKSLF
jgi:hypothetical protein